ATIIESGSEEHERQEIDSILVRDRRRHDGKTYEDRIAIGDHVSTGRTHRLSYPSARGLRSQALWNAGLRSGAPHRTRLQGRGGRGVDVGRQGAPETDH